MGTVVELEGATAAIDGGSVVDLDSGVSTPVAEARKRKALWLFNNGEDDIWLRFGVDGADEDAGIPIPAGSGVVIKEYHGAACAWCEKAAKLQKAEF